PRSSPVAGFIPPGEIESRLPPLRGAGFSCISMGRDMAIQVTCSACQYHFAVPDAYAGKRGKCPKCSAVIVAPAAESPTAAAPAPAPPRPAAPPVRKPAAAAPPARMAPATPPVAEA